MLNVCSVDRHDDGSGVERHSSSPSDETGARRTVSLQRRFLWGLGVIGAVWVPMMLYTERVTGEGGAIAYASLSLVALCVYVLFHRRVRSWGRTDGCNGRRRAMGGRIMALIVGAVLAGFGFQAVRSGASDVAGVAMSLSALAFIAWTRMGRRVGRGAGDDGSASAAGRANVRPSPAAALPIAQVDFLWSLSALVLCGFLVLFVVMGPDLTRPGPIVGLACFVLLGLGVFGRLVLLTWPTLAAPDGSGLLKGALFSSGVFIIGLGTATYMVFDSVPAVLLTAAATAPATELAPAPATPARSSRTEAVTWGRLLPGDTDLIELSESDLNTGGGGSIYEHVADAVVTIRAADGHGTGFLITKDGLAITNEHVIADAGPLVAIFRDGSERPVRVIRTNAATDVALVQIACESDCGTVSLADDAELQVGTEILVIGTPKTEILHHSMTRGIISGLRYDLGSTAIQTDAAISSGNSGSPILHAASGRVIGIVASSLRGDDTEGVHFGIAIWDAVRALGIRVRLS